MSKPAVKLDSEGLSIDVTGPNWLVNLGWWLKEGGSNTIDHTIGLLSDLFGLITDSWCAGAGLLITTALIVTERSDLQIKMVRNAKGQGVGAALGQGTARPLQSS